MNPLSTTDATRYQTLKTKIKSWVDDRLSIGIALAEIKEKKLYRQDYDTFEEFCSTEFNLKERYAYRLIEFAEVKESLKDCPIGNNLNERQARELSSVPESMRADVLGVASENAPLTAESIKQAAKSCPTGHKDSLITNDLQKDDTGWPIPPHILPLFKRGTEARDLLSMLAKIKSVVTAAEKRDDLLFREVNYSGTLAHISNAARSLKSAVPFAVCPTCNAVQPESCTLCKGRGVISEFAWNSFVPIEVKEIRNKQLAKK